LCTKTLHLRARELNLPAHIDALNTHAADHNACLKQISNLEAFLAD
jgi:hypothetical protein